MLGYSHSIIVTLHARVATSAKFYLGDFMSLRAAAGSRLSAMKKARINLWRSAWARIGMARMAASASSGASANRVGTGPFMISLLKRSAERGQAFNLTIGRLSLDKVNEFILIS